MASTIPAGGAAASTPASAIGSTNSRGGDPGSDRAFAAAGADAAARIEARPTERAGDRVRPARRGSTVQGVRPARPPIARKEPPAIAVGSPRRREAQGIVLLALALFIVLSAASLVLGDGKLMGPVGQWVATSIYSLFGAGTLALAIGLLWLAQRYLRTLPLWPSARLACGWLSLCLSTEVLLHLGGASLRLHGMPLGGALGEYIAEVLVGLFGTAGAVLLAGVTLLLSLLMLTELSARHLAASALAMLRRAMAWVVQRVRAALPVRAPAAATETAAASPAQPAPPPAEGVPAVVADYGDDRDQRPLSGALAALARVPTAVREQLGRKGRTGSGAAPASGKLASGKPASGKPASDKPTSGKPTASSGAGREKSGAAVSEERAAAQPEPLIVERRPAAAAPAPAPVVAPVAAAPEPTAPDTLPVHVSVHLEVHDRTDVTALPADAPAAAAASPEPVHADADQTVPQAGADAPAPLVLPPPESKTVDEVAALAALAEGHAAAKVSPDKGNQPHYQPLSATYEPPPLSLFDFEEQKQHDLDRKAMLDLAQRLETTLADYLVKGRVAAIHPGPVVTMYEFVPAPGTKLSKITALSSDLAMALEALRVRIVAPIPGKAAVGIEVPNRSRETVFLKEILADEIFVHAKSKLTMALGKDIAGMPVSVDLAKMPHLLVAGTTGSGKSVSVNGMVCSLLCNASPDDVKMIMIDPKMLELSIYEGIPHLLLPVVTDPKKANLALRWAVEEMERRYELISKAGVRDIGGYNKKVEKQLLDIEQEQLDMFGDRDFDISGRPRKLPYIVVLIDEFADLMMVASKEVETSVARIAQKARAAGIHLILATQRPSVDVITGLIKANFPSRIAFQVASRVDSRTILDAQGAENLLGMGDMLFTDRGQALRRVHGALITDSEVHRVVEHLKLQGQPIYDMDILKPRLDDEEEAPEEDMSDELYDQAVRLVAETRQASISMVQRRLRIGYNRAARMIERMEREGIVSAADGAKGREVLVQNL